MLCIEQRKIRAPKSERGADRDYTQHTYYTYKYTVALRRRGATYKCVLSPRQATNSSSIPVGDSWSVYCGAMARCARRCLLLPALWCVILVAVGSSRSMTLSPATIEQPQLHLVVGVSVLDKRDFREFPEQNLLLFNNSVNSGGDDNDDYGQLVLVEGLKLGDVVMIGWTLEDYYRSCREAELLWRSKSDERVVLRLPVEQDSVAKVKLCQGRRLEDGTIEWRTLEDVRIDATSLQ